MSDDPLLLDAVTGLPNRRALLGLLRERMPSGRGALVLLDLDRWRESSARMTKGQADGFLADLAVRLRGATEPETTLARWGSDAFALLLPDGDRDRAAEAAEALRTAVSSQPFKLSEDRGATIGQVRLTASAAAAEYPIDGRSPALLVETAELALMVAKNRGRDRVAVAGRLDADALAEIGVFRGLPCPVLVGRVDEQTRLRQAAADVRHVGPRLALIDGTPGAGKSRLLRELVLWARSEKFVVLAAVAHEARGGLPYAILGDFVENALATDRAATSAVIGRLPPEHRAALAVSIRGFPEEHAVRDLEIPNVSKTVFDAWCGLLDRFAEAGPLFLALDEAEYADEASLDVVGSAVSRRLPLFFLAATAAPPQTLGAAPLGHFFRGRGPSLLRATLGPLPEEEMAKMLSAILPGAEIDPSASRALLGAARGSPLHLEETIRALLLRGRIRMLSGRWTIPPLESKDLPRDLDAAVRGVAESLPGRANVMLARAAAIGPNVDPEVLQEVMGQDEAEMLDVLDEARRARLLAAPDSGSDFLAFPAAHARKVRLEAAGETERKEIHRRVGVVQEARHGSDLAAVADELAYHYGKGGESARARRFGEVAARRAALLRPSAPEGSRRQRLEPVREPLPPELLERAGSALRFFAAALRVGRLYPKASHVSAGFITELKTALRAILEGAPGLTVVLTPKGPTLNGAPCELPSAAEFAALLEERLIESVTILRNFDPERIAHVLEGFAEPFSPVSATADHWDRFLDKRSIEGLDLVQKAFQIRDVSRGGAVTRADDPVPPEAMTALREALRALKGAVENVRLYPSGHILVEETAALAEKHVLDLLQKVPAVALGVAEGGLVVNGQPGDRKFFGDAVPFLVKEIESRGLWSLTLIRGVSRDEIRTLVGLFASPAGAAPTEAVLQALPHVQFGSFRYERAEVGDPAAALAPPAKPIRSEIRARELLAKPYDEFLDPLSEDAFPALVEALAYGVRRGVAEELVDRLGEHFHDPDLKHRRKALDLLARSLAFASPSCRQVEVARSAPPLRKRLSEDNVAAAFRASADILPIWFPAAATSGCLKEFADLTGPVLRRRAEAAETPAEVRAAAESVLQLIPNTPAYPVVLAALRRPKQDDRVLALGILMAIGGSALQRVAEMVLDEPDAASRQTASLGLSMMKDALSKELVGLLGPDAPPERLNRAADVVGHFLTPELTARLAETATDGPPTARLAVLGAVDRFPKAVVVGAVKRLLAHPDPARRDEGIEQATRHQVEAVSGELRKLLENAPDESTMRKACRYFAAVPSPAALPLLAKIAETRPKLFGIVKGYAPETRAEAIRALARLKGREADEALQAAGKEERLRDLLKDLLQPPAGRAG